MNPHDGPDSPQPQPQPQSQPQQFPPPQFPPAAPPQWPAQPPAYPIERGRNGMAIAGLVLGIIPLFAGILGIIFGLIGRSQARKQNQKGVVMGTWGAALGAAWLVLVIVVVAIDIGNDAKRNDAGQVVENGDESAFSLRVGDCLRTLPANGTEVTDVDLTPCAKSHAAEVYSSVALTDADYPGEKAVIARADKQCKSDFETFVGIDYNDSKLDIQYIYPTARSWDVQDDRSVTCVVAGKNLVGTVKGSKR